MPKKNIPYSFDDSKLPKGVLSLKRSLEVDKLMDNRINVLKAKLRESAKKLKINEQSSDT